MAKERTPSALGRFYERRLTRFLPRSVFIAYLLLPILNCLTYFVSEKIAGDFPRKTLALPIDALFPLIDEFILVYFLSYVFWLWGFYLVAKKDPAYFMQLTGAVLLSLVVCFVFFLTFPLEIARPAVVGDDIFAHLVRFLYDVDAPHNLFPSLHCYYSWICVIAVTRRKEHSPAVRIFVLVFALSVFASTLFLRQHYFLDMVAGIVLAELSMLLMKTRIRHFVSFCFQKLDLLVFTKSQKTSDDDKTKQEK